MNNIQVCNFVSKVIQFFKCLVNKDLTMEKVSRHYSKMLHAKRDSKPSKKDKKKRNESENEDFFTDLKTKKRCILNSRGVQKITTSRLTVRTKTLNNAVRSVFAVKEQYFNCEEDSKALLNEDLFKIIDLSNSTEQKPRETSAIDKTFTPNNDDSSNKSIFREINEKFQQLSPNCVTKSEPYLISDDNLQQLVSKKLAKQNNLILNSWAKTFQDFLHHVRASTLPDLLLARIVTNQSRINESSALFELEIKFRGVPLAGTCLRRKFVRRCNNLTNSQNLGGKLIMISQADDLINQISAKPVVKEQTVADFKLNLKMPVAPEVAALNLTDSNLNLKMPITPGVKPLNFTVTSYKTPEDQRFNFDELATTFSKLIPSVKSKTTTSYIELDREKCTDPVFMKEYGLSSDQQKFFLAEAIRMEQLQSLKFSSIFERPSKTIQKRSRHSIEKGSPKSALQTATPPILTPNRKLNFSDNFIDDEQQNFDFCLLEDIGKETISPLKFGGLFTENGARKSERLTPKRGLEAMLSPNELKLRKKIEEKDQNILARVKRFAAAPEELGPIPTARATPQFTFRPRFLH